MPLISSLLPRRGLSGQFRGKKEPGCPEAQALTFFLGTALLKSALYRLQNLISTVEGVCLGVPYPV